jgi:hypothetical protein
MSSVEAGKQTMPITLMEQLEAHEYTHIIQDDLQGKVLRKFLVGNLKERRCLLKMHRFTIQILRSIRLSATDK